MPQIVEVRLGREAHSSSGVDPVVPEIAAPRLPALGPGEDVIVTVRSGEPLQVARHLVEQFGREGDSPCSRPLR
ncbi:hypothetical protein [Streptomyces nodosus]|uniref:hypothetical protein n=1 Tax=Streptomyces nodosus TaxID=40318 RepID=UPI003802DDC2